MNISATAVNKLVNWGMMALLLGVILLPELAMADGNAVQAKIKDANDSWAIPIGVGILGVGAVVAIIGWAMDLVDWKTAAKFFLAAMLIGVITGAVMSYV
ncbi:hypothetical protein AE923_08930 [Xanthomonas arboricola]|uniref:hypothetical protein n=1 Tax=Xanthomonas arboricola TaxID=56448 RepID=UPI00069DFC6A|nr:hypothetical protein [Xanthomonas arboricola]KOB09327.1 hypothetical protein AE923_08930 [Xanthomonas arboricola]